MRSKYLRPVDESFKVDLSRQPTSRACGLIGLAVFVGSVVGLIWWFA